MKALLGFLIKLWRDESGGGGGDQSSTQKTEPWEPAQPFIKKGFEAAELR